MEWSPDPAKGSRFGRETEGVSPDPWGWKGILRQRRARVMVRCEDGGNQAGLVDVA